MARDNHVAPDGAQGLCPAAEGGERRTKTTFFVRTHEGRGREPDPSLKDQLTHLIDQIERAERVSGGEPFGGIGVVAH